MRIRAWRALLAAVSAVGGLLGGWLAEPAAAQTPLPVGAQSLANLTLTGDQDEAVVAIDPNVNFLVVWRDEFLDNSQSAIIGRRFSARTGQPLSNEFLITTPAFTVGHQSLPRVAVDGSNRFIVVWRSEGTDGSGTAIVVVDPSHEDQAEGYRLLSPRGYTRAQWRALGDPGIATRRECVEEASKGFEPGTEAYRRCIFDAPSQMPPVLQRAYLAMQQRPAFHQAQLTEEASVFAASAEQLQAARRSFMNLPVIVLTHAPDSSPLRDWETPALRKARTAMWHNLHAGVADASARGEHRVVADSDHAIQLSQPAAVVAATIEMVDMARHAP